MKRFYLVIFNLLFFAASVYAWEISAGPTYQDLDISGKVQSHGTRLDIEDDLCVKDDEPIGVNIRLDGERHHLIFDLASVEFSGAKTLERTIQFQDKTYNISTYTETNVEYNLYEAQYYFDLINFQGENLGFSLAPLLKVSIYDAELNLKGGGNDETYSEFLPIPSLGIIGQLDITKYFSLLAQASGIGYSGDNYIEYKSILRIKPIQYLSLDIGYKGTKIDYSDGEDILDIDVKGLFFQGGLSFKF